MSAPPRRSRVERAVTGALTGGPGFLLSSVADWLVLLGTIAAARLRRRTPWLGTALAGAVAAALRGL